MLKTNSNLTAIDLRGELLWNHSLTCQGNSVGKWGGEALYASIAHNSHLKELWIGDEWTPSEFVGMSVDQVRTFTTALEHG